jgi:hypothetical protein
MAKVKVTFEDIADRTVSFLTEIEGMELAEHAAPPSLTLAMATRALFENGMLAEAAAVSLEAIVNGSLPSLTVLAHFAKKKVEDDGT